MKFMIGLTALALVGPACKKTESKTSRDEATAAAKGAAGEVGPAGAQPGSAAGTNAGAPPARATRGFSVAPLGPPDAIEPPTRELVPGMTIAEARAKGATGEADATTLTFRAGTEVWIDADTGLIESLEVEYPAEQWDKVKASFGTPAIEGEDLWIGRNWLASLNGCANGPCVVSFTRAPLSQFSAEVAPPGALAGLRRGMTVAEAVAATGVGFVDEDTIDLGYGAQVALELRDERVAGLTLDIQAGDDAYWQAQLAKLWGAPTKLGDDLAWVAKTGSWMGIASQYGDTLRFVPMVRLAEVLAKDGPTSALAQAQAALGKPVAALPSVPGWQPVAEDFASYLTERSTSPVQISADDADDVVTSLQVVIPVDNPDEIDAVTKQLTAALGPIATVKDENENELQQISVAGLKLQVERADDGLTLTFRK